MPTIDIMQYAVSFEKGSYYYHLRQENLKSYWKEYTGYKPKNTVYERIFRLDYTALNKELSDWSDWLETRKDISIIAYRVGLAFNLMGF